VKTRWGTFLLMLQSLIKQRVALAQAVSDPEFARLAGSARGGLDDATEEAVLDEELGALTRALAGDVQEPSLELDDAPEAIQQNKRYATVYKTVHDGSFWKAAQQYVNLNSVIAGTITKLSGDSACLSDAVLMPMNVSKSIQNVTLSEYSYLFDSEPQVAELQRLWNMRAKHLTSFDHLALLLDPRPEYRKFVMEEPLIVGDSEQKTWGNTAVLINS
jgi:hypothetical protein